MAHMENEQMATNTLETQAQFYCGRAYRLDPHIRRIFWSMLCSDGRVFFVRVHHLFPHVSRHDLSFSFSS